MRFGWLLLLAACSSPEAVDPAPSPAPSVEPAPAPVVAPVAEARTEALPSSEAPSQVQVARAPAVRATGVLEGTVTAHQRDLVHCGVLAVSGYLELRVDVVEGPLGVGIGDVVRVVVLCPELKAVGTHQRIQVQNEGPRTGPFGNGSIMREIPNDGTPTFWER